MPTKELQELLDLAEYVLTQLAEHFLQQTDYKVIRIQTTISFE